MGFGFRGDDRTEIVRGPVSRVLSTSLRKMGDHSSRTTLARRLQRPTRAASRNHAPEPSRFPSTIPCRPYSVLLPVGFTMPSSVTGNAVRSYRTLSPWRRRNGRHLLSVALSLGFPPAGVTRHRGFRGARTFLDASTTRPPGPLTVQPYSSPCGLGSSSASRIIRHSASTSPSISSGRKRRWNAIIAAIGSATS